MNVSECVDTPRYQVYCMTPPDGGERVHQSCKENQKIRHEIHQKSMNFVHPSNAVVKNLRLEKIVVRNCAIFFVW